MDNLEPSQKNHHISWIVIGAIVLLLSGFLTGTFIYGNNPLDRFLVKEKQEKVSVEKTTDHLGDTKIVNNSVDEKENIDIETVDIPQNAGQVAWRKPKKLADLSLLYKEDYDDPSYYEVGTFLDGKYKDGTLILVLARPNTMSFDGDIFRFVKQANIYTLLAKVSSDMFDSSYPPDPNKKNLYTKRDDQYDIKALVFPETVNGFMAGQVIYRERYVHDLFSDKFPQDALRQMFVDRDLGPVYTDSLKAERPQHGFYIRAADGTYVEYTIRSNIVNRIVWNGGVRNTAEYSMTDISGCGSTNYASVVTPGFIFDKTISFSPDNDLVVMGKTMDGDTIFGFKDPNHPALEWAYENRYGVFGYEAKDDYKTFISQYPFFFWKDSFDRLIKFENSKFIPPGECGKPVIYLYPEQTIDVSVKLDPQGGFTVTEPLYKDGWKVIAKPDGTLMEKSTGKQYSYLFWEGRGGLYKKPNKGFVVKREEVNEFLVKYLAHLGLNEHETAEFLEYWLPYMQNSPYYFIGFYGNRVMDEIAPLTITPPPDTIIRILMDFTPLDKSIKVTPPSLTVTPQRKGFTVVEWGGVK